eukprot:364591-Chlamydomonas_euryale.AAC.7
MHKGPVLSFTPVYKLGRVILAQNMLFSASGLGLSRLPRPRPALGLRHAGMYVHACPRPRAGLGLGRRDRPRPAASTNVSCTDHPASVLH